MKFCSRCQTEKHLHAFPKDASRADGKYPYCRLCHRSYQSRWARENPEAYKARQDTALARARAWREAHPIAYSEYVRRDALLRRYGITPEQYGLMLDDQHGRCAFEHCLKTPADERSGVLHVDHDHACCGKKKACAGCVRALLCFNHNAMLGQAHDSVSDLADGIAYLERHAAAGTTRADNGA